MSESTQVRYPARATVRTFVQNLLGWVVAAGVVLPIVLGIVQEELGQIIPPGAMRIVVLVVAVAVAVSVTAARIMAIPQVDAWLRRVGLSARPADETTVEDGPAPRHAYNDEMEDNNGAD